jgi:pyrroline-5-carboxylate reductase
MSHEISFIGAGKMVSAIVKSLLRLNAVEAKKISCCSANDGTSERLAQETGITRYENITQLIQDNPNLLVLGCKPQQITELPANILESSSNTLILSIMAGITLSRLKKSFPNARNIVRSMPNTPGQIGVGITGYLFANQPSDNDKETIQQVLSSLGDVKLVKEEIDIDRVTAISGSGPAYIFEFTCALEEAGMKIGLAPELAKDLAIQTVIGAAKLMEQRDFKPEELRNRVTSPNGTTQAALESFTKNQLRSIVAQAAQAAHDRSIELSSA